MKIVVPCDFCDKEAVKKTTNIWQPSHLYYVCEEHLEQRILEHGLQIIYDLPKED